MKTYYTDSVIYRIGDINNELLFDAKIYKWTWEIEIPYKPSNTIYFKIRCHTLPDNVMFNCQKVQQINTLFNLKCDYISLSKDIFNSLIKDIKIEFPEKYKHKIYNSFIQSFEEIRKEYKNENSNR
jgi:hypothetical protein